MNRNGELTSRERVLTAMRRQQPDRAPFDFAHGFSPSQIKALITRTGHGNPEDYFGADVRSVHGAPTLWPLPHQRYHPDLPPGAWLDEWGVGHKPTQSRDWQHGHLEGFLYPMERLQTVDELLAYPLPDVEAPYRYDRLPGEVAALHERGLAVAGGMECTIFEVAWYMRSMERLLMDFADDSDFARILLDRITVKREAQARWMAASEIDVLRLGDDISSQRGMLMSPSLWRLWLKPRLSQVIAAAKDERPQILICYHTDGDATAVVGDLIEIGVDILNPVQPECMDPAGLKNRYGHRLSFWGAIGTQTVFPFGTPDDVRREVRERIATVGRGGGLLIGPTHMIEPDVPWENIVAFVDAVKECRKDSP